MVLPTTQITYRLTSKSGIEAIKRFEEPLNTDLDAYEVLINIKAVALNYRDLIITTGEYPLPVGDNVIPISDASGVVVKVGAAVSDLQVGDRVITNCNPNHLYGPVKDFTNGLGNSQDGVLTQYRTFPHYGVTKLPKDSHLSHEEAASLVCAGVTAWNAIFGLKDHFTPGQSVLMLGTGGVSMISLILAKAAGAVTIITSSSDEKLQYIKEKYGVDYGINYRTHPDWEKEVMKVTNGEGVDLVIENGGNGTIAKSLASIKIGGQVSLIGFLSYVEEKPDVVGAVLMKSAILRGIAVGSKELSEQLVHFVHTKKLGMPVAKVFGFSEEQVYEAYASLKSQSEIGKVAIRID
ncbi:hypothetical protein MFLAVUS_008424 [Mucor flavus]|uniref:Enoyl reductase (ER) domain-containing protein n=1 Tax=Mucor flavus TaxID=439312 RepID=A0ABP9Z765_9FUNG